jgi:UDP-2-acetamido-2,6-beta-L-arabino-hexul-4-ose reductase
MISMLNRPTATTRADTIFNTLSIKGETLVPFEDSYFEDTEKLADWAAQCDVIVHLAAMNRHNDPQVIYHTNIMLVQQLIDVLEKRNHTPHVLFSSSTQEERDNPYGNSKRKGRELLMQWAEKNGGRFTGMIIPNVYGPFGHPYYNSVVATFCHQLTHNEQPQIQVDGELKLIYINELTEYIYRLITTQELPEGQPAAPLSPKGELAHSQQSPVSNHQSPEPQPAAPESQEESSESQPAAPGSPEGELTHSQRIPYTSVSKVSEILKILESFKTGYLEQGIFPDLTDAFTRNLFNTFVCYIDHEQFFPFPLKLNTDDRGSFVETVKLQSGGQVSFSTTKPGITRGNHYHTRKAERFAVIKGKARIELRRIGTDKVLSFDLDGSQPSFVDMPVWHTHNITNTGDEDVYTIFWISEFFDPDDTDTYYENV